MAVLLLAGYLFLGAIPIVLESKPLRPRVCTWVCLYWLGAAVVASLRVIDYVGTPGHVFDPLFVIVVLLGYGCFYPLSLYVGGRFLLSKHWMLGVIVIIAPIGSLFVARYLYNVLVKLLDIPMMR